MSDLMKENIQRYFERLWPINRSLTGEGVVQSLEILSELLPLKQYHAPSGSQVFDWTIPQEWHVRKAYIIAPNGDKIADFNKNNLHLLGYSTPVNDFFSYEDLVKNIYTLPDQPNAIPYLTSYYKKRWGFCMAHDEFVQLPKEGMYQVVIDADLFDGKLTYADAYLPGKTSEEVVFSTYICHPSMANNELSGPLVAAFLYQQIEALKDRHYSYRFVFTPETIGTIAYLSQFGMQLKEKAKAGFIITCAGNEAPFTYKKSRKDNSETNQITEHILKYHYPNYHEVVEFTPIGSDERQYCSPGFNLPFGSLMRTMYGKYPQYHTSLDNADFISFEALEGTVEAYLKVVKGLEGNRKYQNNLPFGEIQLGKRGLYPDMSSTKGDKESSLKKILYLLNYSDGEHSMLTIAEKIGCSILELKEELDKLIAQNLLSQIDG